MKKKLSLSQKYKKRFTKWCRNTSSHGIAHSFRTNSPALRILWIICFILSLAYCMQIIIKSLFDYVKYDTNVSIKVIYDLPASFPAITICNLNAFNEASSSDYLDKQAIDLECIFATNRTHYTIKKCFNSTENIDVFSDYHLNQLKRVVANDQTVTANLSAFGFDLDKDMLVRCFFNNEVCSGFNFTQYWNADNGNCFTYNDGKNSPIRRISGAGLKNGLYMELVVRKPNVTSKSSDKSGIMLYVHNQTTLSFTIDNFIYIPTGFETFVTISRTFKKKLSMPYSNCINELKPFSDYSRKIFAYFKQLKVNEYKQSFCYKLCYQDKLVAKCNCSDIEIPKIGKSQYCVGANQFLCEYHFKNTFSMSDLNNICDEACPPECNKILYDISATSATFPSLNYIKYVSRQSSEIGKFPNDESELLEFARNSFLRFIINYNEFSYTSIEEMPEITFETLLANIGGQLGLFIGISLLSLIELLELFLHILLITCKHRVG